MCTPIVSHSAARELECAHQLSCRASSRLDSVSVMRVAAAVAARDGRVRRRTRGKEKKEQKDSFCSFFSFC